MVASSCKCVGCILAFFFFCIDLIEKKVITLKEMGHSFDHSHV
jgi:hypothetical protein